MLAEDIAKLMTLIPMEETKARQEGTDRIEGGAFDGVLDKATPFMFKGGEGINAGVGEQEWVVDKERYKYDEKFDALSPVDGKITGAGTIISCLYLLAMGADIRFRVPELLLAHIYYQYLNRKFQNGEGQQGKIFRLSKK